MVRLLVLRFLGASLMAGLDLLRWLACLELAGLKQIHALHESRDLGLSLLRAQLAESLVLTKKLVLNHAALRNRRVGLLD